MKAVHDRLYSEIVALEEELAATRRLNTELTRAVKNMLAMVEGKAIFANVAIGSAREALNLNWEDLV